jgi:hypothetical protein
VCSIKLTNKPDCLYNGSYTLVTISMLILYVNFYFISISFPRRVDVRRPVVKIIAVCLSQHGEKHVVPTPLSVGKGRKKKIYVTFSLPEEIN